MALDYLRNNYHVGEQLVTETETAKKHGVGISNIFKVGILALLISITIVFSYKLWKPTLTKTFGSNLGFSLLKVTGIMSDNEDPMAVVDGKIVREGDIISGYTVCGIKKDSVEFSKNGKIRCEQLTPRDSQTNN